MSRTPESEQIRRGFLSKLRTSWEENGGSFIGRVQRKEVYLLVKERRLYVVFVKVSTSKKGFWGLSEEWLNYYDEIVKEKPHAGHDRIIILLKSPRRGYILKRDEFDRLKPSLSFSNGEYKINENQLDSRFEFWNLDDLFSEFLPSEAPSRGP